MRKNTWLILGLLLLANVIYSQHAPPSKSFYNITDGLGMPGDWTNGDYWSYTSGGAPAKTTPGTSDIVYVENDMNLDNDYVYFGYMYISPGAALTTLVNDVEVKSGATLIVDGTLEVWDLTFDNNSTIVINSTAVIIVHNKLTNKNNSDNVTIDGTVSVTGEFYNGNGGVIDGSGSITASTFTGSGTTFGINPNSSIPPGSTVPLNLPVEFLEFNAYITKDNKIELKWSTAAEQNNDYFTIERSNNASNFEAVGYIKGAGNSNKLIRYQFVDEYPLRGITYYRIKQTDFDGTSKYTDVVSIKLEQNQSSDFIIYPNPAKASDNVYVDLSGFEVDKEVLVVVYNVLGEEQYSKVIFTSYNDNTVAAIDPYKRLSKGTYLIIGSSDDKVYKRKLIIQ
ncbi:MAG: hypothetical protein Kow0068_07430 [Marinilabiliales bacterium]